MASNIRIARHTEPTVLITLAKDNKLTAIYPPISEIRKRAQARAARSTSSNSA